jgi:MFS family permease
MVFWVGTFGLNFPIFISTMSVTVFHAGAHQFGLLTSLMAIGSLAGALLAAGRTNPRITLITASALCFGLGCTLAALMPTYWLFGLALVGVGISVQTFTNTANSVLQLSTESHMRGRIIAMFLAIALGTTPIGAPIVGWIADHFGARWALGIGAASGFAAAVIGIYYVMRCQPSSIRSQQTEV